MRSNVAAVNTERTNEGGQARKPKAEHQLLRQVATCLLFEDTFYENGSTIAKEIAQTCKEVAPETIAAVAIQAREDFKLRHVPLFLLVQLDLRRGESKGLLARTVERVVQRPDEMGELLSLIAKANKGKPLKKVISAQIKKGLAKAFRKFSAYQLGKWNRDTEIKLKDVLFLTHPKPLNEEQAGVWKRLVLGTLETPDTWEVALSAGKDKKETWERLISEGKLGYMALLMNLRNMEQAGVDRPKVEAALAEGAPKSRALPFRFVSAAKAAPQYTQALSDAMVSALSSSDKLKGTTYLLVDVSGSMDAPLSGKGTLMRLEAAAALGVLLREVCQYARVFTFSNQLMEVQNLRGLGLVTGIYQSQPHGGTELKGAMNALVRACPAPDRLIVVTDEQSSDGVGALKDGTKGYLVNVAGYKPALQLDGRWTRISGFSERLVDFVRWHEAEVQE